ncbi:glycosyltransferase family 2 protein [Levilactobacillus brevis]|uniref:glycosyltransferase family 2 protein n=1 Tax=Levilactobacillus brevis TaxID=1580 RepID=UPI0021A313C1|nr:glycosyltransferase [Levilactobacillus brevis]MCT3574121.1 glycosyltransferase [Levilactobacillus brevis]
MRKVSIIVPTYNNERCISNCLTSIIGQTYCKIEVIVIDDGSEDRTGEMGVSRSLCK